MHHVTFVEFCTLYQLREICQRIYFLKRDSIKIHKNSCEVCNSSTALKSVLLDTLW